MSADANGSATPPATPIVAPLGDEAVSIRFGTVVDSDLVHRVRTAAARIQAARIPHVREVGFGYSVLTIWYDSLHLDYADLAARIESYLHGFEASPTESPTSPPARQHEIPVRYDGPDLADVALRTGLTMSEVIARHSGRWYEVYLLGFVPGFAYLGDLDPALVLPRRPEPRARVPAGSVAIAGAQTGIYPLETPGGWHLIGRTNLSFFDAAADPPARLAPGDQVRFVPDSTSGAPVLTGTPGRRL